ncbi:MAG: hypothetical protein ACI9YP_001703, partial [Colwellia sp.]
RIGHSPLLFRETRFERVGFFAFCRLKKTAFIPVE